MWDKVQDFKWIKAGPSPHWRVMKEDRRLESDVWKQLGGNDINIKDVLKIQGLDDS
jgi:tubulin-specific chaperone C